MRRLDVYRAVESGSLFALHSSEPNPQCPCGRNIQPILTAVFDDVENALAVRLQAYTIADIVQQIRTREPWLTAE